MTQFSQTYSERTREVYQARKASGYLAGYYATHPKPWMKSKYGITYAIFCEMVEQQGGKCKLCQKEKPLCVDHIHGTKIVRGLLCKGCNSGIGKLGDNEAGLTKAIKYLRGEL